MPKHLGDSHSVNSAGATARCQPGMVGEAMAERPADILPPSLAPRDLSRVQSAVYVGVGATLFDEMVEGGRMPQPKRVGRAESRNPRTVWDRLALDAAFAALPNDTDDDANPWDQEDAA